jgi:hypothetical protein
MLYIALVSFLLAMLLMTLDLGGWSHGAGGAVNLLLLISLVSLALSAFGRIHLHLPWHRDGHQHT